MKPWKYSKAAVALFAFLWIAGGCTSARDAVRPTISITRDNLSKYESLLQKRIAAEEKSYSDLAAVLQSNAVDDLLLNREASLYLSFNRFADTVLVDKKGVPEAGLADFLLATDDNFDASLLQAAEQTAQANARKATAFAKISFDQAALQTVDQRLGEASARLTPQQTLQFWIDYSVGVEKQFQALAKLDKQRAEAFKKTTPPSN